MRLGIDVGGTKIFAGLVDAEGALLATHRMEARPDDSPQTLIQRLLDQQQFLCDECGADPRQVFGVGLGIPGDFDPASGALLSCPNLPSLVGSRPAHLFALGAEERWDYRPQVEADNDTVVAVLGEAHFGAGRGAQRLLYVTVSTGVGGARYDCQAQDGQRWSNLEPGLRLRPSLEFPDKNLEELAGGTQLARRARRQMHAWFDAEGEEGLRQHSIVLDDPELQGGSIEERLQRLTARHLGQAAARGDAWCRELFDRAAIQVARGLALLLDQGWGEERIVLGGSIALRVPGFLKRLRRELESLQQQADASKSRRQFEPSALVGAGLGEERGILGAVLLLGGDGSSVERSLEA